MTTKKSPGVALWKALKEAEVQDDVDEVLAMSDVELDAFIKANGGDPAALRASGEALAKKLDADRDRLAWQDEAHRKLNAFRAKVDAKSAEPRPKLSREELLARIETARNDPRFGGRVAVMFRNRKAEPATVEELESILFEIELLAEIDDE